MLGVVGLVVGGNACSYGFCSVGSGRGWYCMNSGWWLGSGISSGSWYMMIG